VLSSQTVGVVAVDPSSPFSGGAVLGDRIRMQNHALDPAVFIRSLSTRGRRGGLARASRQITHLLDAFGKDRIVIETVGVGQTELDIMELAKTVIVVLVPEAGDYGAGDESGTARDRAHLRRQQGRPRRVRCA
jgi:LAO/AO transport system kinase